jgi:xanthine dehydrogenase YagR molybdenum-binding subunit
MREPVDIRVGFAGDHKKISVELPAGDVRPWDLDSKLAQVGGDTDRIDAVAKVTGKARYAFDVNLPGMLHGVIVRSPHPRGQLDSLDLDAARAMPGVRAVLPLKEPGQKVRFVGDAVAAIAADRREQALDALAQVKATYSTERGNVDFLKAADAPGVSGGEITDPWPPEAELDQALAGCAEVRTGTWHCEVQTHSALESHGNVCSWNDAEGTLDVWASTQATFGAQQGLARALKVGADQVRVHAEFVGGGFGAKFVPGDEGVACALLSREAKAPVKLMLDRFEEHTCAGNRPSALIQIRAGIDGDGVIKAWDYRCWGGPGFTGQGGATRFPNTYLSAAKVRNQHKDLATDTDAGRAMRAPGYPQGYFAAEGMIDALAAAAQLDPLEFRLKNDKDPVRQAEWRLAAARFGWDKKRNPAPGKPRDGDAPRRLRGAGMSSAFWGQMGNSGRGSFRVTCRIHADGTVESRNGTQDIGTGMKTVMALLTAEELHIPASRVRVTLGDTADPPGPASGGSTTTPSLAPAARLAAALAKRELCARVAAHLGAEPADVVVEEGRWGVPGSRTLTFDEACKLVGPQPIETTGQRFDNYDGYADHVAGCQFAEVEVDARTGVVRVLKMTAVQDCGLVIAKKLAESQVLGAMIQGASYALCEQRIMDPKVGRMLNGTLYTYKVAGTVDVPELEAIMFPVMNGRNNVGAAGLGEPPAVAAAAAVANAVANAIGAPMRALPITPDKVLKALAASAAPGGTR